MNRIGPVIPAQFEQIKIAILRSKVEAWNGPDVLENVCGLLGLGSVRNTNYVLEASFAGLEGHMRVDLASWKELAPHIKLLLVTKPYSYDDY
ncbi:hypothetical protein FIBSPDRAFT_875093 [Athelia psychrophila]|uniref:Uncharacterized protein n=1 Tax=Athelia psychrophila TaxID=1759441 RepID=A0A165WR93_9AGAM|nr:hypothetical protein FIBSPDRAFT_875093 [Fibularhizoctonia sp. CBS 109695]